MFKVETPTESVSVFARFRPGGQDEAHINLAEDNTSLTSTRYSSSSKGF